VSHVTVDRPVMRTVDTLTIKAAPERVFALASQVESWPAILPHYRWVRRITGAPGEAGIVEMAAWRPFGPLRWPTWWRSAMQTDPPHHRVTYQHIAGVTAGMDVVWSINSTTEGWSQVTIVHEWTGPRWPVIGKLAAARVIGPVFVHGIASRTLAGIARAAETGWHR
jgi:ribosome-associated toxin RatA of RatAB toxin-antitoxin module